MAGAAQILRRLPGSSLALMVMAMFTAGRMIRILYNFVVYQPQMQDVGWNHDFYVSERCKPRYNVTGADLSFDTAHRHFFVSAK